jgi:hypothetical protein
MGIGGKAPLISTWTLNEDARSGSLAGPTQREEQPGSSQSLSEGVGEEKRMCPWRESNICLPARNQSLLIKLVYRYMGYIHTRMRACVCVLGDEAYTEFGITFVHDPCPAIRRSHMKMHHWNPRKRKASVFTCSFNLIRGTHAACLNTIIACLSQWTQHLTQFSGWESSIPRSYSDFFNTFSACFSDCVCIN